jgi:hypothetical protein
MNSTTEPITEVTPAVIQKTPNAHVHEQVWEAIKACPTPRASAQIASYTKLSQSLVSNSITYLRSRYLLDVTKRNRFSADYRSGQRLVSHFYVPDIYKAVPWDQLPHTPSNANPNRTSLNLAAVPKPQELQVLVQVPTPTRAPSIWNDWIEQQSLRDLRELHAILNRLFP